MKEEDMDKVAKFIHEGIQIAVDANTTLAAQAGSKGKAATNSKVMASIPHSTARLRSATPTGNIPEVPELGTPRYSGQNVGPQWCPL